MSRLSKEQEYIATKAFEDWYVEAKRAETASDPIDRERALTTWLSAWDKVETDTMSTEPPKTGQGVVAPITVLDRVNELIERWHDAWISNEISAISPKTQKDDTYARGLATGAAIADKQFVADLRLLRNLLRSNGP